MSVNRVNESTGELVTLSSGVRCWIGTKAAHTLAIANHTIPNNVMVCITDDFDDQVANVVEEGNMKPVTSNAVYGFANDIMHSWSSYIIGDVPVVIHKNVATGQANIPKFIILTISGHLSYGDATYVSRYLIKLNFTPYNGADYKGLKKILICGYYNDTYEEQFDALDTLGATLSWDSDGIKITPTSTLYPMIAVVESPFGLAAKP